jgi:hypothetical protein
VSEIPFIDTLGDAIADAIATAPPVRRRWSGRRLVVLVVTAAALLVTAVAAAQMLSGPEQLATQSIGCYSSADLGSGSTTILWSGDSSPVAACAQAQRSEGRPVPDMVACQSQSSVAVIPGSGAVACTDAGLEPLPAGYADAQQKTAQLQIDVLALERSADCIAPSELATQVQALLVRDGWDGWTTNVRTDVGSGPCGSVSGLGGDGLRTLSGSLDADTKTVMVASAPPRSTMTLLYGSGGLAPAIEDESATRCFTLDGVRSLVTGRADAAGRSVSFVVNPPETAGAGYVGDRARLLDEGCALVTDVRSGLDGYGLIAVIVQHG